MKLETSPERSKMMSRIRSSGGKGEVMLAKALWHRNIRYRKNFKPLPGKPDITLTRHKIAIFVDGEFWHGFDWAKRKKKGFNNNEEFWINKIERNIKRDMEVNRRLFDAGWLVLRFWEKDVIKNLDDCVYQIETTILYRQYEKELHKKKDSVIND